MTLNDSILQYIKSQESIKQILKDEVQRAVIIFIDLAGSTALKEQVDACQWLTYVYKFLDHVRKLVERSQGTVVKYIGDEVMARFQTIETAEDFIDQLVLTTDKEFVYKVAADVGDVYSFTVLHTQKAPPIEDPYGQIVDRCARIAKYTESGMILCSGSYAAKANEIFANKYVYVDEFIMKGFRSNQEVWLRKSDSATNEFLRILKTKNNELKAQGIGEHSLYWNTNISETDYAYHKLIDDDTKTVVFVGGNLYKLLTTKTESGKSFKEWIIDKLIQNQLEVFFVVSTSAVMEKIFAQAAQDFHKSIQILSEIQSTINSKIEIGEAHADVKQRIHILCHEDAVTLSAIIVDPKEPKRALMAITIRTVSDNQPSNRPFIVVERAKHLGFFDKVWTQVKDNLIQNGRSLCLSSTLPI